MERKLSAEQEKDLRHYRFVLDLFGLDPETFLNSVEDLNISETISMATYNVIRGEVLRNHNYINLCIEQIIILNIFGTGKQLETSKKTAQYKILKPLLEDMNLQKKMQILKSIYNVPKEIEQKVMKLNRFRNEMAHNLDYRKREKTIIYMGKDINSDLGLKRFINDMSQILNFLSGIIGSEYKRWSNTD